MSSSGGSLTTEQLEEFYRYVMRRCEQADQWQKAGRMDWAEQEMSHLQFRLTRCASEVPDDRRRDVLARVFGSEA